MPPPRPSGRGGSSSFRPLLAILNPRRLDECLLAFRLLDAPKLWLRNMCEAEIADRFPTILDETAGRGFTHLLLVSDDVIVPQSAYDAVTHLLAASGGVVTGWCNLDTTSGYTTLSPVAATDPEPSVSSYGWLTFEQVLRNADDPVRTFHPGMCLTGMRLDLWQRFPFGCYGRPGHASDYHLGLRLNAARVPVLAPLAGFCWHTKKDWTVADTAGRRQLGVGRRAPDILWDEKA